MQNNKISGYLCLISFIITNIKGFIGYFYFRNYISFVAFGFLSLFALIGARMSFTKFCKLVDIDGGDIKLNATLWNILYGSLFLILDILLPISLLLAPQDDPTLIHHINSVFEFIVIFIIFISAELLLIIAGIIDDTK